MLQQETLVTVNTVQFINTNWVD